MSDESPANTTATEASRSRRKLPWILAIVLLLGLAGGGWWWLQAQADSDADASEASASRPPAQYFALEPAFVVNLADANAVRYLQADVQIMTRDPDTAAALELHAPAIRNRLLLLFGQQSSSQLAQRSAKERLQEKALAEVVAALRAESSPDKVEAVLFTSLVTQ